MKAIGKIKIAMVVAAMFFACGSANAQRWHRHGYHGHVAHAACLAYPSHVTVVAKPAVTTHVSNRLNQKERFNMAMAYLKSNGSLTVKQYSKMTGLTKKTAKAELDAFAADKSKPIVSTYNGKKQIYLLRKRAENFF